MSQFGPGGNQPGPQPPYQPGGDQAGMFNPYQPGKPYQPFGHPQTPKRNLTWLWVLLGIGGLGTLALCGCCVAGWFWAISEDAKQMQAEFADDPNVKEHIGEITSCTTNQVESMAQDVDEIWVYDVEGTNGKGKFIVRVRSNFDDPVVIDEAHLELPDGQKFKMK
jgi:hypothetical protein